MAKKLTYEQALERIESLQDEIDSYRNGFPHEGFVYKDAIKELMTLKRGLARRKKEDDRS